MSIPTVDEKRSSRLAARTFSSLGNSDFRSLWFGMLLLMAGVNVQMLARGYLAWELTKSPIAVVVVGAGFAPPILLLSLYGGAVADRYARKRIIQVCQLGMLVITLFMAVSISTNTVTVFHLVLAAIGQGALWAFLMPARQAIIGQLVDENQLTNAVALNSSGMSLMTVAAPGIGGLIYGFGGAAATYYVISVLIASAIVFMGFVPYVVPIRKAGRRMWGDVKQGIIYTRRNRTVLMLLLMSLSTALLAMPFRTLMPVQIEEVFHMEVEALGLLMSMIGVGALFGSLVIAGLSKTSHRGWFLLGTTLMLESGINILRSLFRFFPNPWEPENSFQTTHAKIFKVRKFSSLLEKTKHYNKEVFDKFKWKIIKREPTNNRIECAIKICVLNWRVVQPNCYVWIVFSKWLK